MGERLARAGGGVKYAPLSDFSGTARFFVRLPEARSRIRVFRRPTTTRIEAKPLGQVEALP